MDRSVPVVAVGAHVQLSTASFYHLRFLPGNRPSAAEFAEPRLGAGVAIAVADFYSQGL
ncbi:MAG: hypothetical protein ACRBK7_21285 [Acidimicrobiales bacterium]